MNSYIHHIETTVPDHAYPQERLSERMQQELAKKEKERRIIRQIYNRSGITTRYSVLPDFSTGTPSPLFQMGEEPGTGERNQIYRTEATRLFIRVAEGLIRNGPFKPDEITHLITVSCTGFFAPGPDFEILRALGLQKNVRRYHLGFMGCYASVPALQMADTFAANDPSAVIMIVSAELCTIHFQNRTTTDDLLSASVFADGAAGALVSSRADRPSLFGIQGFHAEVLDRGENDMAWTIGNHGFEMVLTTYIPALIREQLGPFLEPALRRYGLASASEVDSWAVHPGGRAILDNIESSLVLGEGALASSRDVLSSYGNMSSATILFVLKALANRMKSTNSADISMQPDAHPLKKSPKAGNVLAMAFGPGLTLESALLQFEPSKQAIPSEKAMPSEQTSS